MITVKPVDPHDFEGDPQPRQRRDISQPRRRRDITKEWRPVSVRLPPALHDAAIRKASIQDTTVTDVIRNALRKDLGMKA